jgi:hypothetical protein
MSDLTANIIAGVAAIAAIASAIYAGIANRKSSDAKRSADEANKISKDSNMIAQGSLELSLREIIGATKVTSVQAAINLHDFKITNPHQDFTLRENAWYSAVEDNLNAYEKACGLYWDAKIDKERFRKDYSNELRQLVENKNLKFRYFDPITSNYKAIIKTYRDWFDLEK